MLGRTVCSRQLVGSLVALALAGCSSTPADNGTGASGTTTSGSGSTAATTTSGSATSGSSSSGDFDAGGTVETYQTGMGPIMLTPGQEATNCIVIPLGNAAGGFVRRFRANLSEGSHHMIVYTASSTDTPNATPTPCQGLSGILTGDHPVFIAQQPQAELVYPTDEMGTPVGFEIAANQLIKVEFHTINTTQAPLMVTGTAYLDTVPLSTKITQSNIAFWGTQKIHIPANGSFDTGVLYQAAIPGTKSFAVTTHQHHLGTEMKVWYSTGATDTSDMVADGTNWANPPLVLPSPALDFPTDGSKGLAFECHWVNPTASEVSFGESFNDEMCFLWHYYYPSQGFQFCVDGHCG